MNLNYKNIGIGFLFLLMFSSCTEYIDIELTNYKYNVFIDATVTNEFKQHQVFIASTHNIEENEFQGKSGAEIFIEFNDTIINFIESDTLPGFYHSDIDFLGIPGTTYEIKISNIDGDEDGVLDTYEASSQMGKELLIDSVGYEYIKDWEAVALKCYAWDPPETNYYNFKAWRNDTLTTDTIIEYGATDDTFFNGNYTNGIPCLYFQDEYKDEYVKKGDKLTLGIENIDKAYYTYINSCINEYYGYNPMFGGMPANVESNFTNGALGIFKVYTISKASVIVKEEFDRD